MHVTLAFNFPKGKKEKIMICHKTEKSIHLILLLINEIFYFFKKGDCTLRKFELIIPII